MKEVIIIKELRYEKIIELLKENNEKLLSVEQISNQLSIPLATLRRDLNKLNESSKIIKVHGGARINNEYIVSEECIDKKVKRNVEEKKTIASIALKKISPSTTIFLDAGSTIFYLAKILDPSLNLTIVTNSIITAQELWNKGHKNIYVLGGKIASVTGSIVGFEAVENLKKYSFDVSFIGINAIDNNNNIYTTSSEHGQIKIEIMNNSNVTYGLADTSKYNSKSFYKFTTTSKLV